MEDKYDLMMDLLQENECPECGHYYRQDPKGYLENTDADGNRGIMLYCVFCPSCGEEECWYGH